MAPETAAPAETAQPAVAATDHGAAVGVARTWAGAVGAYAAAVVLLATLNFFVPRALPGQPLEALSDPRSATYVGDAERRAAVEAYYGLDQPALPQYARYLAGLARGDLGTSIRYNAPVSTVILERLPWTLLLGGSALLAAAVVGMLAGIHAGWRRARASGRGLLTLFVALDNVPLFFAASAVAYLFAVRLGWFPLSGARTPFSQTWPVWRQVIDIAHHLVLPAGLMAAQFAGYQFLVMRASMVGELGSDYLAHGRAKGMSERVLKYRYAARNALLPTVSVIGLQAGFVVTAAIFVEAVFAYPGLGRLLFEAVGARDYPLMQGVFLVLSVLVLGANLVAELVYRRLDPRVAR